MSRRLCHNCAHFMGRPVSSYCLRTAQKKVEPVFGTTTWVGKRDAHRERASWFGCGRSGKHWTPDETCYERHILPALTPTPEAEPCE